MATVKSTVASSWKSVGSHNAFLAEMNAIMNVPVGEKPKRGDLLQSNVGDRRERTWFVLSARLLWMRSKDGKDRFNVWRARWWELEPDMRMRLYRSAERAGGQTVWHPETKQFENLRRKR